MNKIQITSITAGLLLLTGLAITVNSETVEQIYTNNNITSSEQVLNNKPNNKQAAEITKSECSPRLWKQTWNEKDLPTADNTIGIAPVGVSKTYDKPTIDLKLFIDDKLTNPEQIKHTAWHECAHAKTYTITGEKTQELHNLTKTAFQDCDHQIEECLADAMTEVKLPGTKNHYYQSEFTAEQLNIAEKIWEASDTAKPTTKAKRHEPVWTDFQ